MREEEKEKKNHVFCQTLAPLKFHKFFTVLDLATTATTFVRSGSQTQMVSISLPRSMDRTWSDGVASRRRPESRWRGKCSLATSSLLRDISYAKQKPDSRTGGNEAPHFTLLKKGSFMPGLLFVAALCTIMLHFSMTLSYGPENCIGKRGPHWGHRSRDFFVLCLVFHLIFLCCIILHKRLSKCNEGISQQVSCNEQGRKKLRCSQTHARARMLA